MFLETFHGKGCCFSFDIFLNVVHAVCYIILGSEESGERNLRGMFCLCTVLRLLCSRGASVFHTCSLCLIVFFSLCELVFHCIHLCIHRSHSLVLILLWVMCAWLKLLSLGVCFSAHNVNLLYRQVKHCFSSLNYYVCLLHGQQRGPMLVTVWLFLEMVMAVAMSH